MKKLLNYGFHDTEINEIILFDNYIKLVFKNGIYKLDENSKEKAKTFETDLIIGVNAKYCFSIENAIDVIINRKKQKYDIFSIIKKINSSSVRVHCIYYSNFNNTLLIEGDFGNYFILIKIEHCKEIEIKEK